MKHKIFFLYSILLSMLLAACSNELGSDATFDVNITADGLTRNGDTIIVKKNQPIKAAFTGNVEFISFYNGEPGKNYATANQTTHPTAQLNTLLKFSATPQNGAIAGTLKVFVSENFAGLVINNKATDSTAIKKATWIEITDQCNLSTVSNQATQSEVSLNAYHDKKITLAFLYKTTDNTQVQPTWMIRKLEVVNTPNKGIEDKMTASQIGFVPFDMLSNANAYARTGGAGIWDLRNIASATDPIMRINTSPVDAVINEDWLLSSTFVPNTKMTRDLGTGILDMGKRMEDYVFSFANTGVYSITFLGIRHNYIGRNEIPKSFIVKVVE